MNDTIKGSIIGAIITGIVSLLIFFLGNFSTQETIERNTVETLTEYFDSVEKEMTYEQALRAIYVENEDLKTKIEDLEIASKNNEDKMLEKNEDLYREEILEQAKSAFESNEIEKAVDILSDGLKTLPGDEAFLDKISEYRSYTPVALFEKQILYKEGQMLNSHRGSHKHPDNVGNLYPPSAYEIYASDTETENSITYALDGEYALLTGTLAIRKNSYHESLWVEFYDGDLKLGETEIVGDGIRPVDFEINVTGVIDLTIKAKTNTSYGFAYTNGFYLQK